MFLCFAHNVARLLNDALYLSANVFSARVCSRLQGKALPSFPVVLRFRVLFWPLWIVPPTELVLLNMKLKRVGLFCFFFFLAKHW